MARDGLGPEGPPGANPSEHPEERPPRAPRLTFHGSVLVMTLMALLLMAVPSARQLWRQHTQVQSAERKLEGLQRSNARLDEHLRRLQDPNYLEKLAREELGLVRPGEIGFVIVPGESPPGQKATPARGPWYERMMQSLRNLVGAG